MINEIKQVKDQVEWVLTEHKSSRNSDKDLIIRVLSMYYGLELSLLQKERIRNAPL